MAKLIEKPEYAYLTQLQTANNINWNEVQLAYDRWEYQQEGLSATAAAIITLALTSATGGVGASLAGVTSEGLAAVAANTAFTSLSTQASISLINNKGHIGKTLKELGKSSTVKRLVSDIASASAAHQIGATSALAWSQSANLNQLTVNLTKAASRALIHTVINGNNLKDNLEAEILAALVDTAHAKVANRIKQIDQHYIAHKIAHAVAGCVATAANKGQCQDGAMGAAIGEIVGEALVKNISFNSMSAEEIEATKAQLSAYAKLAAATVVGITGGDAAVAAKSAETAVKNNALSNAEIMKLGEQIDCECSHGTDLACKDKMIAQAVNKSDQLSQLTKQEILNITSVHGEYLNEALSYCNGSGKCTELVGNEFAYARLHCTSLECIAGFDQSVIRKVAIIYGAKWSATQLFVEDFGPVVSSLLLPAVAVANRWIKGVQHIAKYYAYIKQLAGKTKAGKAVGEAVKKATDTVHKATETAKASIHARFGVKS